MTKDGPHSNLWPPSLWFRSRPTSSNNWKPDMSAAEAAAIIEGFLTGAIGSIEWCDFAETPQQDPAVEHYRKRCDKLSGLVNCPGERDEAAIAELKSMIQELRSPAASSPERSIEKRTESSQRQ